MAGNSLFTLLGYMGMYTCSSILFIFLVQREIAEGPARAKRLPGIDSARHRRGIGEVDGSIWFGSSRLCSPLMSCSMASIWVSGSIYLLVARTEEERRAMLRTIGPVWDGNEVWLVAGGRHAVFRVSAALCLRLQRLLSAAHDRAVAADSARHRHRAAHASRTSACGAASLTESSAFASALLADFLRSRAGQRHSRCAARIGQLLLSAPVDGLATGANRAFSTGTPGGAAVLALVALMVHGAIYVALKTEGKVNERARAFGRRLLPLLAVLNGVGCAADGRRAAAQRCKTSAHILWPYLIPLAVVGQPVGHVVLSSSEEKNWRRF